MNTSRPLADEVEFADNPEPRCSCVLLLDTSGSMQGERITALNQGLITFKKELDGDTLARKRVEVSIVTFNSEVRLLQEFCTIDSFKPPELVASGLTCIGGGIEMALDLLESRKKAFRDNGVAYFRPWVFLITDGKPEGESEETVTRAAGRLKEGEKQKSLAFFAVGVEDADMARLSQLSVRTPLKLRGLKFGEMFVWLSRSMQGVAHSNPEDDMIDLPHAGWGYVST